MARKHNGGRPAKGRQVAEYTAAVRYHNGHSELVRVRNADDAAEARALIFEQVLNVHSVVVSACPIDK